MGKITASVLLRHIRRLVPGDHPEQGSDSDLLRRYATLLTPAIAGAPIASPAYVTESRAATAS